MSLTEAQATADQSPRHFRKPLRSPSRPAEGVNLGGPSDSPGGKIERYPQTKPDPKCKCGGEHADTERS